MEKVGQHVLFVIGQNLSPRCQCAVISCLHSVLLSCLTFPLKCCVYWDLALSEIFMSISSVKYCGFWNAIVFFFCDVDFLFLTCHYVVWNVVLPSQMLCLTRCCAVGNVYFCDTTFLLKCWGLIVFCKMLCSLKCGFFKMLFFFSWNVVYWKVFQSCFLLKCVCSVVFGEITCLLKCGPLCSVDALRFVLLLCFIKWHVYWNVVIFCSAVVFSFVNSCVLWKVVFWPSGPLYIFRTNSLMTLLIKEILLNTVWKTLNWYTVPQHLKTLKNQFTVSQYFGHMSLLVPRALLLLCLNDNNPSFDLFVSCSAADGGVLASVEAERWQALMNLGLTFDLLPPTTSPAEGFHRGSTCVVRRARTHTHTHTHTQKLLSHNL